jgi:protein-S-isoprenylcysteine O-methyltransferase Ste14
MLSLLAIALLPVAAAVALGTARAASSLALQSTWLVLIAMESAHAQANALATRSVLPGLSELLGVWAPVAFVALLGWAWRTMRAL